MIRNTFLFIITLLLNITAFAQSKSFTVKKTDKGDVYVPERIFEFKTEIYFENRFWKPSTHTMSANELNASFLRTVTKQDVDSIKKACPTCTPVQSRPKNKIILGVSLDTGVKNSYSSGVIMGSKTYPAYIITNNSKPFLVAMGINKYNVKDFRYHIVEDDSVEVVPWSVPILEQKHGAKAPYGGFGELYAPGKQLMVEVVNIKDYSQRDGMIFDWRTNYRPSVAKWFIAAGGKYFEVKDTAFAKLSLASKFDPATRAPLDLKFTAGQVEYMTIDLDGHAPISYRLDLVKDTGYAKKDTSIIISELKAQENSFTINNYDHFDGPGKYTIIVKPLYQPDGPVLKIPFEVLPPAAEKKKYTLNELIPQIVGVAAVIGLIFLGYYFYNKRKLKKAEQQRALANIKLNSVRSQLNPHFMFNALTSIQNLMNQQDTEGANHYLSKFAGLTRQVLSTSAQELVSLADELKLMTDYLQMEQLRFGFEYEIKVDDGINQANTDIPNMLLQPFIENAAKHGVSALQSMGKISVTVSKRGRDLVFVVADNGPGFGNGNSAGNGVGVKISKERIDLLNQIYKDQPTLLNIDSTARGATITITLTNWL